MIRPPIPLPSTYSPMTKTLTHADLLPPSDPTNQATNRLLSRWRRVLLATPLDMPHRAAMQGDTPRQVQQRVGDDMTVDQVYAFLTNFAQDITPPTRVFCCRRTTRASKGGIHRLDQRFVRVVSAEAVLRAPTMNDILTTHALLEEAARAEAEG